MKKPIRFNLQFQDGAIASLNDLEEKMNINDLYSNFQSGALEQWFRKRGEIERADGVSQLEKNDEKETLLKLFDVLKLGFSEDEIRETVESYENQKKLAQIREKLTSSIQKTIAKADVPVLVENMGNFYQNRLNEYRQLIRKILSYSEVEDFPIVKSLVNGLFDLYPDYIQLGGTKFISSNAFAMFAVMMNLKLRRFFCSAQDAKQGVAPADDDYGDDIEQRDEDNDVFLPHKNLPKFYSVSYNNKDGAGMRLKIGETDKWVPIWTNRKTAGYECSESKSLFKFISVQNIDDTAWRKLTSKEKRVMILSCGKNIVFRGNYVIPEEEQMPIIDKLEFRRVCFRNAYSESALFYIEID